MHIVFSDILFFNRCKGSKTYVKSYFNNLNTSISD